MSRHPDDIETDMRRLRRLLDRALAGDEEFTATSQKQFLDRISADSPTRILDLACGACDEAEALVDYFAKLGGPAANGTEPDVSLTGIDIRAREIADAAKRFRTLREGAQTGRKDFEFLNGDATKIDQHKTLGENFDVVFMRHQNLWNGRRTWEEIFDKALQKLDDDGRLIITSYFDREHQLALEAIQRQGGELISTCENEESRAIGTPGKSVDRHVAVFRKKQ